MSNNGSVKITGCSRYAIDHNLLTRMTRSLVLQTDCQFYVVEERDLLLFIGSLGIH